MKQNNHDKARIRVFFGEIEGDNATLKDALRSIGEAVKQTFQQEPRTIKVIATGGNLDQKQLAEVSQAFETEALEQYGEDQVETVISSTKPRSQRPKKAATYSLVKDLNLQPLGKKGLREFFDEKQPKSQEQQITIIVYYLHRILEVETITTNHVFTGMKHLNLRVPSDLAQTMRTIASRKAYIDTSNTEDLKMAIAGDNFVEHDLPATKATSSSE